MSKKYKALITTCWILLFSVWLFTIITGKYIPIWCENEKFMAVCSFIDNHVYIKIILKCIMYYLNWIFIYYCLLGKKLLHYKPIIISLIIILFWTIKEIFGKYQFINYIDFMHIIPLAILLKKNWYFSFLGVGVTFLFALISSMIKGVSITNVNPNDLPTLIVTIFSIDVYIMCIIYYLHYRKGEQQNGCLVSVFQIKQKMENFKCSIRNWFSSSNRIYRSIRNWRSIIVKDFYFFYCSTIFFIITYGTILIFALLFDRPIEISVCVLFFHIFRKFDKKTYHASNDLMCWLTSFISFGVITLLTLPLTQSILACICMSYILSKIMFLIRDYIDIKIDKKNIENLQQLHKLSVNDLLEMFSEYDPCYIKAFYDYIHKDKYTTSDNIAIKHHISRATLFRTINKIKKELNIK